MKKYKLLALVGLFAFALIGISAPLAAHSAQFGNMRSGETVAVGKNDVIEASAYLAGNTVTVAGTVQGDLYCAGQNIDITGRVDGDVICAGQTVHISGVVTGDVRVAGQTVTLDGPVGRSLTAFGQSVTQTGSSVVNNDATVFGSALQFGGKVGRDIVAGGETVTMAGSAGRDMTVTDDQLTLTSGSVVGGNVSYTSSNTAVVDGGAKITGKTNRHEPPKEETTQKNDLAAKLSMAAYWFGAMLVAGLALLAFAPRSFTASNKAMHQQGGWALLAGLAVLVATPIVAFILMATVIALPVAFVLLFAWFSALLVAYAYAGYGVGSWIAAQAKWQLKWAPAANLLIGLIVLWLAMLVPIVGGLLGFVALVWGLGGMMLAYAASLKGDKAATAAHSAKKAKA